MLRCNIGSGPRFYHLPTTLGRPAAAAEMQISYARPRSRPRGQTVTCVPTSTTRPVGIWKKSVALLADLASPMNNRSCHSGMLDCAAGRDHVVTRILDQQPAYLDFVKRSGLTPGGTVRVLQRDEAADALTVRVDGGKTVTLGHAAASKILVATGRLLRRG